MSANYINDNSIFKLFLNYENLAWKVRKLFAMGSLCIKYYE